MRVLAIAMLLAACERTSALYCENNPDKCTTPMIDAPIATGCTTDQECHDHANGKPFCIDMATCGECRTSADCAEPTATCEAATHDCRGCTANSECPSDVCLDSGACAPVSQVAYVGGTVESTVCTMAMPCNALEDALALMPTPRYIRVVGNFTESGTVTFSGATTVDILGSGFAALTTGVGLRIEDQSNVAISNLEIHPATVDNNISNDCILVDNGTPTLHLTHVNIHGCGGDTVDISSGTVLIDTSELHNSALGVEVLNSSVVGISHTVIHHNSQSGLNVNTAGVTTKVDACVIAFNASGVIDTSGLEINGNVAVTNTVIARNGSSSSTAGGVRIGSGTSTLDFVTLADNITLGIPAKGMTCSSGAAAPVANSIIHGNLPSTSATCLPTFTLLDNTSSNPSNKSGDPLFIANITDPTDPHFYRLQSTSPAINAADPSSTVAKDIDGDARPTGLADMGADEYHP